MKVKVLGFLAALLTAIVFMGGGVTGVSVAKEVYLPITGVAEFVYSSSAMEKGLPKLSAISKNVEIDFGKGNYLLYNDKISGKGIGVFVRNELPKNSDNFSNSNKGPRGDWIIQPASKLYTIVPVNSVSDFNGSDGRVNGGYGAYTDHTLLSPSSITLQYDQNVSDIAENIALLYRRTDSDPWEVLPAVVNPAKNTLSATFPKNGFGSYCVVNMDSNFKEFSGGFDVNWSQPYVMPLWTKGIMSQTTVSGGYFGLVDGSSNQYNMLRGEFACMLVKGMRLPLEPDQGDVFSDLQGVLEDSTVSNSVYYSDYYPQWQDYAYTSAKYGLFSGIRADNGALEFQPNRPITREQAAVLIVRAAKLKLETDNENGGKIDKALEKLYTDYNNIGRWARPYVLAANKAKYMVGQPVSVNSKEMQFNPTQSLTRAEGAKVIYSFLKKLKLI